MRVFVFAPKGLRRFELEERLYEIREAIEANGDESVVPIEFCPFAEDLTKNEIDCLNAAEFERCDCYYSDDGFDEYAESCGKQQYFLLV